MQDIGFHSLVDRQAKWSRFTHWTITREELIQRVQDNWHSQVLGYRPGVVLVPIDPAGFFSPVVVLKPGDGLTGVYASRQTGEEPRKMVGLSVNDALGRHLSGVYDRKVPAVGVSVVLYHKDVLVEDGETFAHELAILSVNARITEEEEPMQVETLLANHFHVSGGTATGMNPVEFEKACRESFLYWRDKTLLG